MTPPLPEGPYLHTARLTASLARASSVLASWELFTDIRAASPDEPESANW